MLREAPDEMIAAGMGDMLGKVTALADWKLGRAVNGEYYCPAIVELVVKAVKRCIESLDGLIERDGQAVKSLTEGLILSGIAMQMTGNSRPASGAEHHISHYWEMQHLMRGEISPLHGNKVAAAIMLVSALYGKILEMDRNSLEVHIKSEEEYAAWEQDVRKNYGSLADDVITAGMDRRAEILILVERLKSLRENWNSLIGEIRDLLNLAPYMSRLLKKAGAPVVPGDIGIDFSMTWSALRLAKEVRERYTVLQFADQLGVLSKYAKDIAEEYCKA